MKKEQSESDVELEFTLPSGGEVMVKWPSVLSKDEFHDIRDWLKFVQSQIGRSVSEKPKDDA
jgi:hypothetical protein